jgi:hypothetical protein
MALTKITKTGITDSAVDNNKIEADAIDATKIADNAISEEHLDATAITGNTELSANAASDDILLIYDASNGTLKKINASNVGLQAPTISSVSPTNVLSGDGTGNYTLTITGTGFLSDVTAKIVTNGGTDIAFDSVTRNSSTQLTCVIAKNTANLTNANEPFDIVISIFGGLSVTSEDAFTIDASPVFVTASGSLGTGTGNNAESFSVNATDPESAAAVTFELQSGTLPPGLSLSNSTADGGTAIISGTATDPAANTTYNFTLRAVDAASNVSSRAFSITINRDITFDTFTASGTFAVPAGVTSLTEVLVVGGGGGGGGGWNGTNAGGGAGAGGLIFFPCYPVTPGGTITITVGCGGPNVNPGGASGPGESPGINGQNSVFGAPGDPGFSPTSAVLTAQGGGAGGGGTSNPGFQGGSGGGGGTGPEGPRAAGQGQQPTQPGNSGAYGFGNGGGVGGSGCENAGSGGGAGAAGGCGNFPPSGGGIGRAYTIADGTTPVYYAGGGGGGASTNDPGNNGASGGQGGGGTGGGVTYPVAQPGTANRGGGGGGGKSPGGCAAPGGKGVVIIKY